MTDVPGATQAAVIRAKPYVIRAYGALHWSQWELDGLLGDPTLDDFFRFKNRFTRMALKPRLSSAIMDFLLALRGATEMCRKPRVSSAIVHFLDGLCQVTYDTRLILKPLFMGL